MPQTQFYAYSVVSLPDAAVQKARERVRSAPKNSGYSFPIKRITINLTIRPDASLGRRIVVRPDNRVEIGTFTPRPPERGQVLIETLYTLISAGTELGRQEQERTREIYPGYANVGRIAALGEDVTDYAVGDVVLSLGNHATHVVVSTDPA